MATAYNLQPHQIGGNLSSIIKCMALTNYGQRPCPLEQLADEEAVTLHYPGHYASATFKKMKDPTLMRIYSTNWKCEHEVNGVYPIEEARDLYRKLRAAGAVVLQRNEISEAYRRTMSRNDNS